MKKRVVCTVMVVVFTLLFSLTTASLGEGTPTVLTFVAYCGPDSVQGQELYPLLDKFMAENPDIVVNTEYVAGDDLKTKIKADAAADMLPDVFHFWGTLSNNAYLLQAGRVATTEEVVAKVENLSSATIPSSILETMSFDGVAYGLAENATYGGVYVNTAVYEECGVPLPSTYDVYTYEQFRADGEIFKEKGFIPMAIGWQAGNPGHNYLSEIYHQLPGGTEEIMDTLQYKNPTGSGNLATCMRYVLEDIELGMYQAGVLNDSWNEVGALFAEGRAAAMWNVSDTNVGITNPELNEIAAPSPFPRVQESDNSFTTEVTPYSIGYGNYVSKKSWDDPAKQEAIARFLNWFYGPEHMEIYCKYQVTPWDFSYDISYDDLSPINQKTIVFNEGKAGVPLFMSVIPDSTAWQEFKNVLMDCASGMITPEECEVRAGEVFDAIELPQ